MREFRRMRDSEGVRKRDEREVFVQRKKEEL